MSDGIRRGRCSVSIALWSSTSTWFLFANSATVVEKSWIIGSRFFSRQLHCKREERATLFLVGRIAARDNQLYFHSFVAPFAERPKVEGGQFSWPKYIKTVHLVFCESVNGRHNKYSDQSLAMLDFTKIFHGELVTKRRYRFDRNTYLWLSAILLGNVFIPIYTDISRSLLS